MGRALIVSWSVCLMRFALDGDSNQLRSPASFAIRQTKTGTAIVEWPSPFEHRNERMNSMIFEALLAAIGLAGYIAIQVRWHFGAGDERQGLGQHCEPGAG